jgi:hypothetical protein
MARTKKAETSVIVAQADDGQRSATIVATEGKLRRPVDRPIVLEYRRKKRKKNGYSKEFRDVQRTEARLARASEKAARAVFKGAEEYNRARERSVSRKRDGAIKDFNRNLAEGLSESIQKASSIPVDLAEAMNTKSARRMLRDQLRMSRNGLRIWRW